MKNYFSYLLLITVLSFQANTILAKAVHINSNNSELHINEDGSVPINGKLFYSSTTNQKNWLLSPSFMLTSMSDLNYRVLSALSSLFFWEWFFSSFFPKAVKFRNKIVSFPINLTKTLYSDLINNKKLREQLKQARKQDNKPIILKYHNGTQEDPIKITDETTIYFLDQSEQQLNVTLVSDEKDGVLQFKVKSDYETVQGVQLTDINNRPIEVTSYTYDSVNKDMHVIANIIMQQPKQIYPNVNSSAPYYNQEGNDLSSYSGYSGGSHPPIH